MFVGSAASSSIDRRTSLIPAADGPHLTTSIRAQLIAQSMLMEKGRKSPAQSAEAI